MTIPQATGTGTLYIVATPIGNRDDITIRALRILNSVDLILAEDTRHSLPLLTALGIKNKLAAYHAHNESEKSNSFLNQLLEGKNLALISDAGTPLISDPGFPLVQLARKHQISVVPIPGPCAVITALSAAGIPCDSFTFVGFLPAKQHARREKLAELLEYKHSVVFYESTHRILECLEDIAFVSHPERALVLAKELTKSYERFASGSVKEIITWLQEEPARTKGEFVLILPPEETAEPEMAHEALLTLLLAELPLKQAVSLACKITNGNKNDLYEQALILKNKIS